MNKTLDEYNLLAKENEKPLAEIEAHEYVVLANFEPITPNQTMEAEIQRLQAENAKMREAIENAIPFIVRICEDTTYLRPEINKNACRAIASLKGEK